MAYGHAERNLALLRQLEAETRQLLESLDQPDPEQSAWLQEVTTGRDDRWGNGGVGRGFGCETLGFTGHEPVGLVPHSIDAAEANPDARSIAAKVAKHGPERFLEAQDMTHRHRDELVEARAHLILADELAAAAYADHFEAQMRPGKVRKSLSRLRVFRRTGKVLLAILAFLFDARG